MDRPPKESGQKIARTKEYGETSREQNKKEGSTMQIELELGSVQRSSRCVCAVSFVEQNGAGHPVVFQRIYTAIC